MSKILPWMTVALRDDMSFSRNNIYGLSGYKDRRFVFGKMYSAQIKTGIDNKEIDVDESVFRVMLEDANCDYITKKYKQFSADLLYDSVLSFLGHWNIIDRRVLIEKNGCYL